MWRGCLLLIAVYAATWYLEYLQILALPFAGHVAAVLALFVTLFLGSLQGLAAALRLREQPQTDISQWRDGAPIRIAGVLQTVGEVPHAPISNLPAVFCEYSGRMTEKGSGQVNPQPPHWRGMLQAPCVLRTPSAKLEVIGIPSLDEVPYTHFHGRQYAPQAAHHLATTAWQQAPEIATVALGSVHQMFIEGRSSLPPHLINATALDRLQMQIGQSSEADLRVQLERQDWRYEERIVPPGATVTLVGTYRASPPGIDINQSVRTPEHRLLLGTAAESATRQLGSTVIFIVVLAALTAAAHFVVHAHAGAMYLGALQQLGLTN